MTRKGDLLVLFTSYWDMLGDGTAYETDYKGLKPRKFEFDIAFVDCRVAVEVDGGIWTSGRHTRGAGYTNDCIKNNLAITKGWVVFRFTPDMLKNDPATCIRQVLSVIEDRTPQG